MFSWFVAVYLIIYIFPFAVLVLQDEIDLKEPGTRTHFRFAMLYILSYVASGFLLSAIASYYKRETSYSSGYVEGRVLGKRAIADRVATVMGYLGSIFIVLYYVSGGYKKIMMLGSEIEAWEYRIIGYDDTSRVLTALLEISRRILMPYALLVKLAFKKFHVGRKDHSLLLFLPVAVLGAVVNLDRGPVFLYLFLAIFFILITSRSGYLLKFSYLLVFIFCVGVIGGVVTLLQHNIVDFDLVRLSQTFFPIVFDRIVLDPVRMAEEYAFSDVSLYGNPLYLKYSRLGALVGAEYVGTEHQFSFYVTPVGLVGDIWRNFGMPGAVIVGMVHGLLFKILSSLLKKCDFAATLPVYFLVIILIFYLFYSGMFSQGPFALLFMIFIMSYSNKLFSREYA